MLDNVLKTTNVEPRPYQRTIVEKTVAMYHGQYKNISGETEVHAKSVMVESATGSGKTVMGHLIAKVMQEIQPDLHICWVAMRRNLLTQAQAENTNKGINVKNIHYISMFDSYPQGVMEAVDNGHPILLCIDESQHDSASSMAHLHNIIKPTYILGLTATPFRTDRVKLCFDKIVKDAGIHQLIQDGYLSQFHHYTIPQWDAKTVADFYIREPERWGKSIFYFHTLDECHHLSSILEEHKETIKQKLSQHRPDLPIGDNISEVITGSSKESEREDQLARYRKGEVPCLINCMVLTEGFDDPTLETAFVRDSVKGPTMQMAGRAFRQHPDRATNPIFEHKKIVQSKNTHWPILKTAAPEQQLLWRENDWASLTVNPHLKHINNTARAAIARTVVEIPKFIQERTKKKRVFSAFDR
jgi:superfamily II DNA or RNA helicase